MLCSLWPAQQAKEVGFEEKLAYIHHQNAFHPMVYPTSNLFMTSFYASISCLASLHLRLSQTERPISSIPFKLMVVMVSLLHSNHQSTSSLNLSCSSHHLARLSSHGVHGLVVPLLIQIINQPILIVSSSSSISSSLPTRAQIAVTSTSRKTSRATRSCNNKHVRDEAPDSRPKAVVRQLPPSPRMADRAIIHDSSGEVDSYTNQGNEGKHSSWSDSAQLRWWGASTSVR